LPLNAAINQLTDVWLKLVRVQVGVAHKYPNLLRAVHSFLAVLAPQRDSRDASESVDLEHRRAKRPPN